MGQVWRALDVALEREVAIKFIREPEAEGSIRERFLQEARALARIQHPNVVAVYRIGTLEGQPYLAYELVSGHSLETVLGALPWQQVLTVGLEMARGLEAAHDAGVLHRDLKPANVMRNQAGVVKLIDFGLAKRLDAHEPPITSPGTLVGTPRYLAPELWKGESASPRSDIYGLGLILWELLAGLPAYGNRPAMASLVHAILQEPLASLATLRPEIPLELAVVVDRAVSKAPKDRFASAQELRTALESLQATQRTLDSLADAAASASLPSEREVALVRASLTRVLALPGAISRLYARLFERHPELRVLFPVDLAGQARKLAEVLQVSLACLRQPSRLRPLLEDIGARHVLYGVGEAELDMLRPVLFEWLAELEGRPLDEELRAAWSRAWKELEESLRQGMRRASKPMRSEPSITWEGSAPTLASPTARPTTHYAHLGSSSIAYQSFGSGPTHLVFIPAWVSHCEAGWLLPEYAHFFQRLGTLARVTIFDKRGTGLSDRPGVELPQEERIQDLKAVQDAVDAGPAVLFGLQDGAAFALHYAALYPERVRGLVLYGSGRRLVATPDYPHGLPPVLFEQICLAIQSAWGAPLFAENAAPSRAADPAFTAWWADYLRLGASPGDALSLLRLNATCDIDVALPAVPVPTLVLHRQGDRMMAAAGGRYVASRIPQARYVELPGEDHLPWVGDSEAVVNTVEQFLKQLPRLPRRATRLVTVLAVEQAGAGLEAGLLRMGARAVSQEAPGVFTAELEGPVAALRGAQALREQGLVGRAVVHTTARGEGMAPEQESRRVTLGALREVPAHSLAATVQALGLAGEVHLQLAPQVPPPGGLGTRVVEHVR
jgi:pimeloyl-ACP methyl ester carboxylesterase/hemoglobin-like flavoprotein